MTPNENAAARVPPPEKARITSRSSALPSEDRLRYRYPLVPSNAPSLVLMGWPAQAARRAAAARSRSDRTVTRTSDLLREDDRQGMTGRGAADVDRLALGSEVLWTAEGKGVQAFAHREDPVPAGVVQVVALADASHEDLAALGKLDDHVFQDWPPARSDGTGGSPGEYTIATTPGCILALIDGASDEERALNDDAGHAFVERRLERAELALGWLCSAEPRFGQPGRAPPAGRERRLGLLRQARRREGQRLQPVERGGRILARRGLDEAARFPLEQVHARVGMRPAMHEGALVERAQVRRDRLPRQQGRAGRDQEPQRELDRVHLVDQPFPLDELEHLEVVLERRPRRERDPGRPEGDSRPAHHPNS